MRVCRAWLDELSGDAEPWRVAPGVALEDKTYSLSFHYRHARNRRRTLQLLEERAKRLVPAPTLLDGKCVLNLIPPGAPDKGEALAALLAQSRAAIMRSTSATTHRTKRCSGCARRRC